MQEGLGLADVVDQHDTVSVAVVRGGHAVKLFLARRVPNLKFDSFPVHLRRLYPEVNAYGGDEGDVELVFGVPEQNGCLAHTAVSYQDKSVEVVVCGLDESSVSIAGGCSHDYTARYSQFILVLSTLSLSSLYLLIGTQQLLLW